MLSRRAAVATAALMLTAGEALAVPDLAGITVKAIVFKPSKLNSIGEVEIRNDRQKDIKFVIADCTAVDASGQKIATGGPVVNDIRAGTSARATFNMDGTDKSGDMTCTITTLFE